MAIDFDKIKRNLQGIGTPQVKTKIDFDKIKSRLPEPTKPATPIAKAFEPTPIKPGADIGVVMPSIRQLPMPPLTPFRQTLEQKGVSILADVPLQYKQPQPPKPQAKVDAQGRTINTISTPGLGGGVYYDSALKDVPTTPRGDYGGVQTEPGKERDHVVSLFLGGVDTKDNIRLRQSGNLIERFLDTPVQKIPRERRQEGKVAKELEIFDKYKRGEINRAQAITELKRWEFEKELKLDSALSLNKGIFRKDDKPTALQDITARSVKTLGDITKNFVTKALPSGLKVPAALGESIFRTGLQTTSALGFVTNMAVLAQAKLSPSGKIDEVPFDELWKNEVDKAGDRMVTIGSPFKPIANLFTGGKDEESTIFREQYNQLANSANKKFDAGDTTGGLADSGKIAFLRFSEIWSNPFYLFSIKGVSSGSFKITPQEKIIWETQLNPIKKDFLIGKVKEKELVYNIKTDSSQEVLNITRSGKVKVIKPDLKMYVKLNKNGIVDVKITNSGSNVINPKLVRQVVEDTVSQQSRVIDQAVLNPKMVSSKLNDIASKMNRALTGDAFNQTKVSSDILKIDPNNVDSPGKFFTAVDSVLKKHNVSNPQTIDLLKGTTQDFLISLKETGLPSVYVPKTELPAAQLSLAKAPLEAPKIAGLAQQAIKPGIDFAKVQRVAQEQGLIESAKPVIKEVDTKSPTEVRSEITSQPIRQQESNIIPEEITSYAVPKQESLLLKNLQTKVNKSIEQVKDIPTDKASLGFESKGKVIPSKNFDDVVNNYLPSISKKLDSLYSTVQPKLDEFLSLVKALPYQPNISVDLKRPTSLLNKIIRKRDSGRANYGLEDVNDFVRGLAVYDDVQTVNRVIKQIEVIAEKNGQMVAKVEDFFEIPNEYGYRGKNIDIVLSDGSMAELQLHTPASLKTKDSIHSIYEKARPFGENVPRSLIEKSKKVADDTYKKASKADFQVGITSVKGFKDQAVDKLVDQANSEIAKGNFTKATELYKKAVTPGQSKLRVALEKTPGVEIQELKNSLGRFSGETEPTLYTKVKVDEENINDFVLSVINQAEKFKQKSVIISRALTRDVEYGIVNKDLGISYEPAVTIQLNKKIELKDLAKFDELFTKYDLAGATIAPDQKSIELINLSKFNENYAEFTKGVEGLAKELQQQNVLQGFTEYRKEVRHIGRTWDDALTTYGRVRSNLQTSSQELKSTQKEIKPSQPKTEVAFVAPEKIDERLASLVDKDGIVTVYRASAKFPKDKLLKDTFIATDPKNARYYAESHYKGSPQDITIRSFKIPASQLKRGGSADAWQLKNDLSLDDIVVKPRKEMLKPTETEKRFSTHYEKIKEDLGGLDDFVEIEATTIKQEARKAFDYIQRNPQGAMRVAYGIQPSPPNINAQAVRISLIESLKSAGKLEQARDIAKRMSAEFTKTAQELNLAKLDTANSGQRRIEGYITAGRLSRIGEKIPATVDMTTGKKTTPLERGRKKLESEAKRAAREVENNQRTKSADDLLRMLIC